MVTGYYHDVIRLLKEAGFTYKSCVGSHEKWVSPLGFTVIVPKPVKSRHTANAILKQAGINHKID